MTAQTTTITISPAFECTLEVQPLAQFQEDGHFVPSMQDSEQRRRPWEGEWVYILQLHYKGSQVLRVLADSEDAAVQRMRDEISASFFGLWLANNIASDLTGTLKTLQDERNETMAQLRANGLPAGIDNPALGVAHMAARLPKKRK